MAERSIEIGIVVARQALSSPWGGQTWLPCAVLPGAPAIAPWTALCSRAGEALFYAGSRELVLHSGATAHYLDNLAARQPSLWIALSPADDVCRVTALTADPYEGEALTDGLGRVVDAVPMPDAVKAEVAAFIAAFHVERPFFKRERDRVDADALGFNPAVASRGERE